MAAATLSPRRRRVSPLQSKGMMILLFVLITESVTLTKAVQLWSTIQSFDDGRSDSFLQRQQPTSQGGASCSALPDTGRTNPSTTSSSSSASPVKRTLGKLSRRIASLGRPPRDCCQEFVACSARHPQTAAGLPCALISRGGHLHQAAAEAAGEALVASKLPYNIPLNGWKVIFQALLTTLNVVCWLVPLRSKKISDNKLALSLANAFSGGVFLSLAFGHLIPECVHGFEGVGNEATPYLLVLAGYLLIFFVEKVAFDAHEILHEMEQGGGGGAAGGRAPSHNNHHHGGDAAASKPTENGLLQRDDSGDSSVGATSGRSALILLGALAVHSILEMAALGLADTFADSAILTLSIALHQPAESIALLVAFLKSGMPKGEIIRFLSIFSAMGPVGVALGMAVNQFAGPLVDSVMVAVVAGTFVYVGATEVIPEEWEDSEHKWKKFAALMGGIVSILAITQYTMTLG